MKNRLIWILTILLCALLYLFENNAGTRTLLVGVLVLPGFSMLVLAGRKPEVTLTLEPAREKGQPLHGELTVTNGSFLPQPRLTLGLSCRNLRTLQTVRQEIFVSLLPHQTKTVAFALSCGGCGKVRLTVENVRTEDVLGLVSRKRDCTAQAEAVFLPRLFEPAVFLEHQDMAMPDSDSYSQTRPGSDPGETFAVREYVPGDAIRKIHWKLSEKTGQMMVREFGMPVVNEVALLLENAGSPSPEEIDAVTEVFASVSNALVGSGVHHKVFWWDQDRKDLLEFDIASGEDFAVLLGQLLELSPRQETGIARRFVQRYPHCPYAHVIAVGSQYPDGIGSLYNGNRVSSLILRQAGIPEGLQPDGTHVLSFTQASFAQDLCRLEV